MHMGLNPNVISSMQVRGIAISLAAVSSLSGNIYGKVKMVGAGPSPVHGFVEHADILL